MAKRKASGQKAKKEPPQKQSKGLFQVRFEQEVLDQLKAAAAEAGISVNQLMQAMCKGCLQHFMPGEARKERDGFVTLKRVKGVVSFGREGTVWDAESRLEHLQIFGEEPEGPYEDKGELFFTVDFTERIIVPE